MADVRRVYIDSCSFIDMVKVAINKEVATDRERDVWHLKRLLEAARDKELEAYTSTLTISECLHIGEPDISDEVKFAFSTLLTSGQYVRLVQPTLFIAEEARDLRWKHGLAVKGADGIHVASAIDRKCEELLTTNGRLQRLGAHADRLARLGVRLIAGRNTLCLPDKYRQLRLIDDKKKPDGKAPGAGVH
jgi:predicted nucleic acid-binding protein